MSKEINIVVKNLTKEQKFDAGLGYLELKKSGNFSFTIKAMDDLEKTRPSITNIHASNKAYEKYHADLKVFETAQAKLIEDFKNLSWCWQLVGNGIDPKLILHNDNFLTNGIANMKTNGTITKTFPEFLEGGGMVWLEAFDSGSNDVNSPRKPIPPTGKAPRGIFVRALGTPEIIGIQWKYIDNSGKVVDIPKDATLKFGQTIQLHVYTKGLYGQEIDIQLMNKNLIIDDKLPAFKRENGVSVDLKPGQIVPDMPSNSYFRREVVAKTVDGETVLSTAPQGTLKTNKISKISVQKAIVDIVLDPFWVGSKFIEKGEHKITIYAKVKHDKSEKLISFNNDTITVKGNDIKDIKIDSGNNPLTVGQVETNVAAFQPCRYDKIELKKQKKAGSTIVFDSKDDTQRAKKSIDIEIIGGKKETYLLDFDIKSQECHLTPKHTTKEITIINVPKEFELKIDPSSTATHVVEAEKFEWEKRESKSSTSGGMIKSSQKEEVPIEKGIVTVRQKQIEFDAFYNYDIPKDGNSIWMFTKTMQYFWMPNLDFGKDKITRIKGNIKTCAFKQDLNITIYPDIKWSLIFGFNVKKEQLTVLIPSWDKEKTVSAFEWKDDKFKKIDQGTQDKINNKMLDVYKKNEGTPKPKPEQPSETKGKISTLLEIMKKVNISLKAQIYEDRNIELTFKFYKDIYDKLRWAVDLMDGKLDNPKNKAEGDKVINDYLKENELNARVKHLTDALTRKPQEIEIVYPKFSLGGNWQYETVDTKKHPEIAGRAGLAYNIAFAAKPLIGLEIKWHILDLLCRRHPFSYAILAAVKTILTAIGDNPDGVKVDMWVKGEINADVKFEGNFLVSDKKIAFKGESHITAGVDISITLIGKVVKGSYEAVAQLGIGAKGEVGLGQEGAIGVDNEGWFLQTSLIFDGIKVTFEAVAEVKLKKKVVKPDGTVEEGNVYSKGGKSEFEITLLAHTFKSDPFYFKKFE
jgi:hypothetical protein